MSSPGDSEMSGPADAEMTGSEGAEMSGGSQDSEMSGSEDSEMSGSEDSDYEPSLEDFLLSIPRDADMECDCGRKAKLLASYTQKNPSRLFYVCPKKIGNQCGYFEWADELVADKQIKYTKEFNLVRFCTSLQKREKEIKVQWDNDREVWQKEKSELMATFSAVQAELDAIKKQN